MVPRQLPGQGDSGIAYSMVVGSHITTNSRMCVQVEAWCSIS